MENRSFFESTELNDFYQYCERISDNDEVSLNTFKKEINDFYVRKHTLSGNLTRKEDSQYISADYLIKNIDLAFTAFDKAPWKKDVSFDDFCEYILPYRVYDEEVSDFRNCFYQLYSKVYSPDCTMQMAADSILKQTSVRGMYLVSFPDNLPHFPARVLKNLKGGTCVESSSLSIYIMRSAGLPVAQDFTPQWPHRAGRHTWSALLLHQDSSIDFEGVNASKTGGHILLSTSNKLAKVYRRTFSIQKESLAVLHGSEEIPSVFQNSYMKDVSADYFSGASFSIRANHARGISCNFVYINVFDNRNWQPVAWAPVKKGIAQFQNVGKRIVYLLTEYHDGKYVPISAPFLVDGLGNIRYLVAGSSHTQSIKLYRKYPVFDWWDSRTLAMIGGRLQAANQADFSDAKTIYTIRKAPPLRYHTIKVRQPGYRYWRYLAHDSSYGEIAELEFYGGGKEVRGSVMGTQTPDSVNGVQAAFDGNRLTYFQSAVMRNNWIGMDFKKCLKIDEIRFLGRNDGNFINEDDTYELFYWNMNGWQSLGKKRGSPSEVLFYQHVPLHALLLLRDLSQGSEERIFTYSNCKQNWW